MAVIANRRSVMTLYSGSTDIYSHQVRIVLAEKGVSVEISHVSSHQIPEDLLDLNPHNTLPTLVDRELVLYNARIIMEYLDERFPHPPLMPVYPVMRARSRLMMYRIDHDWYRLLPIIEQGDDQAAYQARIDLTNSLISVAPLFTESAYFLNDGFSLIDCCVAPLLWRLNKLGIVLPEQGNAIKDYADRVFQRDAFQASLTDIEQEMIVE